MLFSRWLDFILLYLAHDVNNALINMLQFGLRQRSLVDFLHVFKNDFFPLWLVDGHAGVAFELANLLGQFGSLVQQFHETKIEFVNLFAPVGYIHKILWLLRDCESQPRVTAI